MTDKHVLKWPLWVLILDLVGTILVALGIYAQVVSGPLIFRDVVDLRALAVPMIIIGALLVAPLVFSTVSQLRAKR